MLPSTVDLWSAKILFASYSAKIAYRENFSVYGTQTIDNTRNVTCIIYAHTKVNNPAAVYSLSYNGLFLQTSE